MYLQFFYGLTYFIKYIYIVHLTLLTWIFPQCSGFVQSERHNILKAMIYQELHMTMQSGPTMSC